MDKPCHADETVQPFPYTVVAIDEYNFHTQDSEFPGERFIHSLIHGQRIYVDINLYNCTYRTKEDALADITDMETDDERFQLIEIISERMNHVPIETLRELAELVYDTTNDID